MEYRLFVDDVAVLVDGLYVLGQSEHAAKVFSQLKDSIVRKILYLLRFIHHYKPFINSFDNVNHFKWQSYFYLYVGRLHLGFQMVECSLKLLQEGLKRFGLNSKLADRVVVLIEVSVLNQNL